MSLLTLQKEITAPQSPYIFDPVWISKKVQQKLPSNFVIRPLRRDDYDKGYLETLSHLTVVGNVERGDFEDRFAYIQHHQHKYFHVVIEDTLKNKIAAAGTIFLEEKFIRHLGRAGHLEDVALNRNYQCLDLEFRIMEQLKHIAIESGCYKIIFDSYPKDVGFFEKCGYKVKGVMMANIKPVAKL